MLREETQDLRALTNKLTKDFPQIETLYLFGSRRYRTGSTWSDIDILVKLAGDSHIRPLDLRVFSSDHCRALDFFVAEGGKAVSCANESHVRANTFEELVTRLEAVCFWNRAAGLLDADIDWEIKLAMDADFAPTAMTSLEPIGSGWARSFQAHLKGVEAAGLPVRPYFGCTVNEIGELIVTALGNAVSQSRHLNPKGKGWKVALNTEYDFQNLFFVTVKPWLPGLGREEVTIHYDGQEKRAA
jgi:REase_DpnII-MboI